MREDHIFSVFIYQISQLPEVNSLFFLDAALSFRSNPAADAGRFAPVAAAAGGIKVRVRKLGYDTFLTIPVYIVTFRKVNIYIVRHV